MKLVKTGKPLKLETIIIKKEKKIISTGSQMNQSEMKKERIVMQIICILKVGFWNS